MRGRSSSDLAGGDRRVGRFAARRSLSVSAIVWITAMTAASSPIANTLTPVPNAALRTRPRGSAMNTRVLVLGAGFGGLELATTLSEALGDDVDVTLIDKNDAFVFGYSKLDVMFGRTAPEAVRLRYGDIAKPGVQFLQQTVTAID